MADPIRVPGLPFELRWQVQPVSSSQGEDGTLRIEAPPLTDLFVSPAGSPPLLGAPRLTGRPPDGDYLLTAHVEAPFGARFDAGALVLWAGDDRWAKLAIEWSPQRRAIVVSVVTRGLSDDANGSELDRGEAWLRIARIGDMHAFHASRDGRHFHFVRQFALGADAEVGLLAQSPAGEGCRATFRDVRFEQRTLQDLRDGT